MGDAKTNREAACSNLIGAGQVLRFFCLFMLVFVPLMVLWPWLQASYSKIYRVGGTFLFGSSCSNGIVQFCKSNDLEYDVEIHIFNRDEARKTGKVVRHSTCYGEYINIAFLTALILATPISCKRRAKALFWGLILLNIFFVFRLAVLVIFHFSTEPVSIFVLTPFWERMWSIIYREFVVNCIFGFIASIFIWILVSFRRDDWNRILMRGNGLSSKIQ